MEADLLPEGAPGAGNYGEVFRFYKLAKRAGWAVAELPWTDRPLIPELRGSAEKRARRLDVWRSVITQQLQADELAVEMSAQLFSLAPHPEAKLYYSTMVQDESRHCEAWLKMIGQVGGTVERDPHLAKLARATLDADTLEEKVFMMQVFFERLIIPKFKAIARAALGTVLEDLCNRLSIDDGIHHAAGMAYERVLLERATKKTKNRLVKAANLLLPVFVEHEFWRPRERAWMGTAMRTADVARLRHEIEDGIRMAQSLGLDVSDIHIPPLTA